MSSIRIIRHTVEGGLADKDGPMSASYFRALASRCGKASHDCFDLFAKEEFRRLATEFNAKADELDFSSKYPERSGRWRREQQPQSVVR